MRHYSLWSALLHGTIMTLFSILMVTAVYAGPLKRCGKCNTMVQVNISKDRTFTCSHCNSVIQDSDDINRPSRSLKASVARGVDPHSIASQLAGMKLLLYPESQATGTAQEYYTDSVKNTRSNSAASDTSYEKHTTTESGRSHPVVTLPLSWEKKTNIKLAMKDFGITEFLDDSNYKAYSPSSLEQQWYNDLELCFLSAFDKKDLLADQLANYLGESDFNELDQGLDDLSTKLIEGNENYFVITVEHEAGFSLFGVMVTGIKEMVMFVPGATAYQASGQQSLMALSMFTNFFEIDPISLIKVYEHMKVEVKKKPS